MLYLIADLLKVRRIEKVNGAKPFAVVTVLHSNPYREREILRAVAQTYRSKRS